MNLVFQQRMQTLYQQFIAFDALQTERTQRYRNIEPESALFLAMQIRVQQSKKILEIGTSTGYSTLWLANAAQETQGQITTLEIEPDRTAQAQHDSRRKLIPAWRSLLTLPASARRWCCVEREQPGPIRPACCARWAKPANGLSSWSPATRAWRRVRTNKPVSPTSACPYSFYWPARWCRCGRRRRPSSAWCR